MARTPAKKATDAPLLAPGKRGSGKRGPDKKPRRGTPRPQVKLRHVFTAEEITRVCDYIREGHSEVAALKKYRFRWSTWRARRRENPDMDRRVLEAEEDLKSHLMSMGAVEDELRTIKGANLQGKAQAVKVKIWARMEMAKKIDPERYGDRQKVEHSGRIAGMSQLLDEIDGSETGVGRGH